MAKIETEIFENHSTPGILNASILRKHCQSENETSMFFFSNKIYLHYIYKPLN